MAELDTEHVRMLDAGRQRVAYSSPLASRSFASVASKKTQLLQHGNTFGLSFLATEKGFVMTKNDELEASCTDYTKRRQEAIDHGQKLTLEEIHELPVAKEVQLPSTAYWITLSPDELTLAVAYGDAVALFEVAHIVETTTPAPFHTFTKLQAQEIAWCSDTASERLAVLTLEKQVVVCTLEGAREAINTETDASSIAWSPSGEQIAVGLVDGTIAIFARDSLEFVRSIAQPESCADQQLETHHVNWAEENLILAGYHKYDEENEETSALACIFDNGECVELDEVVGFFDVEGRRHQYLSVFLPDWRMFFITCSLSADIELLVSDPDGGEWQLWKPLEKYQARLPMNADDEESFPMGFAVNLNSTTSVPVDEDTFPPVPIISCTNTEGLLVNFAFVDTTVSEVDFVKGPSPFEEKATRTFAVTSSETPEIKANVPEPESPKKMFSHEYGQNDENEFAESDGESSDEEEERKEEEEKARATFRTMASDGADYITPELFPKLFKAMGATYDEEAHTNTVKDLEKEGKIYENDFVAWYMNWIFGDEDLDSDEDEDVPASEAEPAEMKSKEEIAAAFSKFTAKEGSWKCAVCMVSNGPDAMKCSACETPNPAAPKMVAPVAAASATSAGSIGSGGFSFPVSTRGDSTTSFSFNATSAAGASVSDASKSTGFSFGGAASSTTGFSFPTSTASSGTGFNFGAATSSTTPATSSGFSFGVDASGSSDSAAASKTAASIESSEKNTKPASPKKTISHEYGQNDENEFAESDGESSDEEEERKEEEEKARATFRTMASDGADYITPELFPKLFKAMGATYDEEAHTNTVKDLEKEGKIYENDFVAWYMNWIFGDEDLDSDEDEDVPASEAEPAEMKSKEEIAAAFSKFTAKEGSWKCAVCMVSNGPDAMKCSACETPNPAAPKMVAPVAAASATSAGSIGSGGFSFPVSTRGDSTTSFSFNATSAAGASVSDASKSTGFSFGGAASSTTGFSFPTSTASSGTGFNFGAATSSTTPATSSGFSFGVDASGSSDSAAASKTAASIESSEKNTKPASPKKTISHEYGQNDENEFAESDGESSDEEEERKEEEEKARATFRTMASDGADYITPELFPKLFKAMGATYDEEAHTNTVKDLEKEGKIYENDFVAWYMNWIFGDEDLDSDEDEDVPASEAEPAEMKSKEEIAAAFSKFTAKEGSWKCAVCMVSNGPDAMKCSACETPNPAAPKMVAPVAAASATSAGSIGSGGFSFPVSTRGDSTTSFSFNATSAAGASVSDASKSTGFSFGGAASSTTGFSFPTSTASSGTGFNFGAATSSTTPATSSGFSFGVDASGSSDSAAASKTAASIESSEKNTKPASPKKTISHEYGQNDENEFAESDGESSDEEEERQEEEEKARATFRTMTSDGADYITPELFPKLFKAMGATYDEEAHTDTVESLEKDGKIYENDFVAWYVNWIFGDEGSDSEEEDSQPVISKKTISHEYGQNDENEFAECDESSDEEEARKEEADTARVTFRTIAADGTDYIVPEQFPKLIKAMGATYDEEEHINTVKSLERDGKIYENDFVIWYVNWIFGDEDLDSDDEEDAPAEAKPAGMKSKEEIAAAFSKFTAKEGSWKCAVCMVSNGPDAMKCSACETPNPSAPKVVAPVKVASATSAGSIGSGGFSFPVSTGGDSKPSSFSFSATPAAGSDASKSTGFSFGGGAATTGFSFPSTSGTGFTFPSSTKPAADSKAGEATTTTARSTTASGSGYPPDTTSKPKPPAFGAARSGGYPPDTSSKPKPPAFGAASGSGYPPDTTSKPKPPAFGAASSGGYPPDTTSKPKPPVFGAASSGGYPPDTTLKPKPPAFGAASGSGYPPDTTSKPKPPAFGVASSGGYPPDTTSKPKPPTFGAVSSSGYSPDTTSKPKPPAFGASSASGYPPDTTSKPKPPTFGAASGSGYPPDTTSNPKPPVFGAASGSSGYPPDTSKPKSPMFGQSTASNTTATSSSFGFGSFGKSLFGSKPETSASTGFSAQTSTSSASTITATKPNSLFGSSEAAGKAPDTSSPFCVVPKTSSKSAFSFGSASASDSKEGATKSSSARPSFSFDKVASTLDGTEEPPTKRTLKFGDASAFDAKAKMAPSTTAKAKPVAAPAKITKDMPSSHMEGQLWKLIVDFDKSLQRVNEISKNIPSKDAEVSKKFLSQMDKLRAQISSLCDEINSLDESRDQVEKDVLFVIGSDGDVHEQLEYGREILDSFNDEGLKRTLEEQPLDQRSKETWDSLKNKLSEVQKCCVELDSHVSSSKIGTDGTGAVSSAHLFRVLKQTYDNSKLQYNKTCKLAKQLEKLSLRGDLMRQSNGVSGISGEAEAHPTATKAEMIQVIVETEQRSQDVRRNFLSLCNNVVTPRDVFSTPRRKLAPPTSSNSSNSPLRIKACSKLMPKTQLSVASPMSSAKQSSRSVSFQETSVKSGSKLFSLAEAMAPKEEPAKLVQTPQPAKPSVGVGKAPQRPSLGAQAAETKPTTTTAAKPNAFSFPKPKEGTSAFGATAAKEPKKTPSTPSFGGLGVSSPAVKRKAETNPAPAFSLGGKEAPASSAVSFGSKDKTPAQPSSTASATNYKVLLEEFYKVHNPSKTGSVIEKALTTYKGREEDLFTRLFTMYVPDSTPEDVKKYLSGGPVPPKPASVAASKAPAPTSTAAKSPFGGFGAPTSTPNSAAKPSPFGASPSAFSLGPAANTSTGFSGFGSAATSSTPTTTAPSLFGQPAVDYRQKLVEFYQKHNPSKLSSVDATLQKYKGNEEKLFQNLATKYKVNASPAVQPANSTATASPFGKPGAFLAPSTSAAPAFGSTSSVGFGAAKPAPSASPFGAPAAPSSSPFGGTIGQTSTAFGPSGGFGGFQATSATTPAFGTPSPFGTTAPGFGAAGGVNYREKLTAFYQQHNPAKLSSVDATLEKYKGREDHLFAMLEQKYLKNTPTAPAGGFGVPSTTTFGGGGGFGAPSALGAGAVPAFGSASTLGGAAQPAFGAAAGAGFGMASRMGGGFGAAAPAAASGAATGTGFSAFGTKTPSFGGAAQQAGGFGATANNGGFGSSFGGAAAGGFGQPAAFSSTSFTQMR